MAAHRDQVVADHGTSGGLASDAMNDGSGWVNWVKGITLRVTKSLDR